MKELLNKILRGIVIGATNIIPGVSGGTMMVSMGIYDTLIHCITHIFKEFWKSIKTLLPYGIGMLIGILALASAITWGLEQYPLPTNTLFVGLILGGLKPLVQKIDRKKINAPAIIAFVCMFALIIWMGLVNRDKIVNADTIEMNLGQMLLMVALGAVASATMIIPGVSGSLVLMLLGYYKAITGALESLTASLLHFNFSALGQPLMMLIPFTIGIALGVIGVAKLIEWLTARFPNVAYCGVLGLVLASPVSLLLQTNMKGVSVLIVIISILTFAVGFVLAYLLAKGSQEKQETKKEEAK